MSGEAPRERRTATQSGPRHPDLQASSPRYRRLRPGPGLSREKVAAHQRSRLQRATVEIVAEAGYEALTVRGLAKRARISTGAFYRHYQGTDDCFLATFDLICRRASERLTRAGRKEPDPERRLGAALEGLLQDVIAAPKEATFALRAAPAAGPSFTGRLSDSELRLALAVEACVNDEGLCLPPILLDGIAAGLTRVGRISVPKAGEDRLAEVANQTAEWIVALCVPSLKDAERLNGSRRASKRRRPAAAGGRRAAYMGAIGDDRGMILTAVFRIAKGGYHELTIPRICREAGVARRDFNRHFSSLEECFASSLEECVNRALAASVRGLPASTTWSGAVYSVLGELCGALEGEPESARVLLADTSAAGTAGIDSYDRQISQVARVLRSTAPEGSKPSQLAAEASTAAAGAILGMRVADRSPSLTSLPSILAFLMLAPALGGPAALRAVEIAENDPARS